MSENIRNRNGKPFNFINGLKIKNVNVEGSMGASMIGYNGQTVKTKLDSLGSKELETSNAISSLQNGKADKVELDTINESITALEGSLEWVLNSNPTNIAGASAVTNVVSMTQEAYDALPVKNDSTIYVILE